jgi:hypothetical protein
MKRYEWTEFALFYGIVRDFAIPRCSYLVSDVDVRSVEFSNIMALAMLYKRIF